MADTESDAFKSTTRAVFSDIINRRMELTHADWLGRTVLPKPRS